jgi:preprotein translocase subunit SecD
VTSVTQRILLWTAAILLSVIAVLPSFTRVPDWWPLGAPIRLGLDLRGGTHLLYGVDLDEAVRQSLRSAAREAELAVREAQVGAFTVDVEGDAVLVRLADKGRQQEVRELLATRFPDLVMSEGLQASGADLALRLGERTRLDIRNNAVEQALQILRNRIDQFGVAEPTIQAQGDDEIVVQLPGVQDPQRAKELIGRTALLEFRFLAQGADAGTPERPGPGSETIPGRAEGGQRRSYVVEKRLVMTGDVLTDASVRRDVDGYYVDFVLDPRGAALFGEATSRGVGRDLAIMLDGQVQSAPRIQEPITGGQGRISGRFTVEEAQDLANVLRNGALPAPLDLREERTVGPSLGRDSIRAGVVSFATGSALVVLFMLLYYRGGGLIADVAVLANVLMLLALFAAFGFTLTLPGIAGIVLTVGMAVDANVLILERVREELREGKPARAAIDAGYERAWSAILDSNVTTFVSGLILFQFGSGPVRGFAATLCLGIVTTVITAVYGTRLVYDWIASGRRLDTVSV